MIMSLVWHSDHTTVYCIMQICNGLIHLVWSYTRVPSYCCAYTWAWTAPPHITFISVALFHWHRCEFVMEPGCISSTHTLEMPNRASHPATPTPLTHGHGAPPPPPSIVTETRHTQSQRRGNPRDPLYAYPSVYTCGSYGGTRLSITGLLVVCVCSHRAAQIDAITQSLSPVCELVCVCFVCDVCVRMWAHVRKLQVIKYHWINTCGFQCSSVSARFACLFI